MALLRILYASDFHGSDLAYRKFLNAVQIYDARVAIVGGDVTGKAIVPVLHKGGGHYEAFLFNQPYTLTTKDELAKFRQIVANAGFYALDLERDQARELENDQAKMDATFARVMSERICSWMELAEQTLAKKKVQFYFMAGNDDLFVIDEAISSSGFVRNHDGRKFWLDDDHELIGIGHANMTPWNCPRDVSEEELERHIETLVKQLDKPAGAVFNFHAPPYDTLIDQAPGLDKDMRIITEGGQVVMMPVGSKAVRAAIEQVQPLLGLHAHIHESAGFQKIGRTLIVNAGSEYAEGIMKAALINLEKDKVKGHMLVSA